MITLYTPLVPSGQHVTLLHQKTTADDDKA